MVRRIKAKLVACVLALSLAVVPLIAHDWDRQAQFILSRLIIIETLTTEPHVYHGNCTAWVWDAVRGLAITAGHCVRDFNHNVDREITVRWKSDPENLEPVTVVAWDDELDLALIQANGFTRWPALRTGKTPKVGKELMAAGFANGKRPVIRVGALINNTHSRWISHQGVYEPGMSGGVLTNRINRVVGVLVITQALYGRGGSVPIEKVLEFARANRVP